VSRAHRGGRPLSGRRRAQPLDAEGCDTVLLETGGVRHQKVEAAHGTIVVLVPGMGGGVQSMKAGIMEFAGVFVIGQPDRPCARGRASSTGGV